MSTPVLVGTRLCGFSHLKSGQYLCLDSGSGETIWADEYAPVARYEVAPSPTWAHPVVLPGRVLVKDKEHLTLLRFP